MLILCTMLLFGSEPVQAKKARCIDATWDMAHVAATACLSDPVVDCTATMINPEKMLLIMRRLDNGKAM